MSTVRLSDTLACDLGTLIDTRLLVQASPCSVSGCTAPVLARGWCGRHYQRWTKYGDPVGRTLAQRFWEKVDKDGPVVRADLGPCWLWIGATNGKSGYGLFRGGATRDRRGSHKWVTAHRFAYELEAGPLAPGHEPDHLCRVRLCVRVSHLEAVTHRVNTLRGTSPAAQAARREGCGRGHRYTPATLRMSGGKRRCRICDAAKEARRTARRRAVA